MGQTATISRNNTRIDNRDGYRVVTLHSTPIVKVASDETVTLDSGGWRTVTTKTRINQVSNEWGLGFTVYQKDYAWYVALGGRAYPFHDGITFNPWDIPDSFWVWRTWPHRAWLKLHGVNCHGR